jgi:hypothetical protein
MIYDSNLRLSALINLFSIVVFVVEFLLFGVDFEGRLCRLLLMCL